MFKGVLKKMSVATLLMLGCQMLLLVAMQLVSQRLGKSGYGRFGLAMSMSVFAAQFIQWGMDQLLTVKFVRGNVDDSRRLLGLLLRQKQLASLFTLFVGATVALCWNEPGERLLVFLGIADGVCLAFTIPSIFDARGKTATCQLFAFIRHTIYLGILLLIGVYCPERFTPLFAVELHLICVLPELILEQIWIYRKTGAPLWPVPVGDAYALWRDAAPMALAMFAQQVLFNCGLPIMRAFGREAETGGLYLSNQFTIGATSFVIAPGAILHARLALHSHEGPAFRRMIWLATGACALAGVVISLSYPIVCSWIVRHFFKSLADSTPTILMIDTWRLALVLASVPLSSALICLGRLRAFAACHILAAIVGIGVSVGLVSSWGIFASPTGIIVGRVFYFVLCIAIFIVDSRIHRSETIA